MNRGGGFVPLGGYVKQISASLDATGKPEVFAVGSDDALWVNHATGPDGTGSGFVRLGGLRDGCQRARPSALRCRATRRTSSARGTGASCTGDELHPLGGYIQTPSGSTSNGTNSWAPPRETPVRSVGRATA